MIEYRLVKTKWGILAYAARQGKLIKLFLPATAPIISPSEAENKRQIQLQISAVHAFGRKIGENVSETPSLLDHVAEKLVRYFSGEAVTFSVEDCDLSGRSEFARLVLLSLARVEYGQTRSYREIAEMIGKAGAYRAVAGALARNPIPIIIPCHRIIQNDGQLGGYSGGNGVEFKQRLLEMEQKYAGI
jgi:methylated-DNA-[protein]-cysteine S-methyltransferase